MGNEARFGVPGSRLALYTALGLVLLLVLMGILFRTFEPDLESRVHTMVKKEETLSRMRVNLLRSVEIEKGAVMADTDELSRALALESMQVSEAVERDRLELMRLMEHDRADKEFQMLREFDACWAEQQKIDKVLLDFAVENSNVKASNLSFSQGRQAMDRFKQSLGELMDKSSSDPHHGRTLRMACSALTAGFEILLLHGPHIAAANDADMDRIEADIRRLDALVRKDLEQSESSVSEGNQALLREAASTYEDFHRVTAQVLRLSRLNTNIKSFELSLGRKRKVTAQCDEILNSLQSVLRSRVFEATR